MTDRQAPPEPTIAPRAIYRIEEPYDIGFFIHTVTSWDSRGSSTITTDISLAQCYTYSRTWTSFGDTGFCMSRGEYAYSSETYISYDIGKSCIGSKVTGTYYYTDIESGSTTSRSGTYTQTCSLDVCKTFTIYQASPNVGPSLLYIGCASDIGMPPNAPPSVYSEVPSLTVSLAGPIGGSPQTDTSSGSLPKETGATSEDQSSPSGGGGPNVGLIAGAVVGGVAGIVLIVLAFFLGRKFASKRKKDAEAVETTTADPASPQPSTSPVTQLSVSPLTQAPASPVRESVVAPFGDPDQQQKQLLQEQQLQQQQQQQPAAVWGQTQPATWGQQGGTYFYSQPVGNMAELPPPEVQELPGQSDPYQYYGGQGAVSQSPPPQAGQGFGQQSPQTTQQA